MARAQSGDLLQRRRYTPEYGSIHLRYQRPMFHVLQSSYEDLEYEINEIRSHASNLEKLVCFIGMDGLGIMRMNHTLALKPFQYLCKAPATIPVLGEYPHGAYHIMHGDWRNWWDFHEKLQKSVYQEPAVKQEPKVSDFKLYDHAVKLHTRACAEYLLELALDSDGNLEHQNLGNSFLTAFPENLNLEVVVMFLDESGFPYLQFREAVGCNEADELDLVWREKLGAMRTQKANKTQYAPMSIMHMYWQNCLIPELKKIQKTMRTLSLKSNESKNVGWDYPIENQNLDLRRDLGVGICEESVATYVENLNFTKTVEDGYKKFMRGHHREKKEHRLNVDKDVEEMKEYLRGKCGQNYKDAKKKRARTLVSACPWKAAAETVEPQSRAGESQEQFIRRHFAKLCTWTEI
jgi:hypothetical protein